MEHYLQGLIEPDQNINAILSDDPTMSDNFFNTVPIDWDNALNITKCIGINLCANRSIILVFMVK